MFRIPGMLFSCAYRGFIIYADNGKVHVCQIIFSGGTKL